MKDLNAITIIQIRAIVVYKPISSIDYNMDSPYFMDLSLET